MSRRGVLPLAIALHALLSPVVPARAGELSLLAGATDRAGADDSSYAWQIAFRRDILPHLAASLSWLNEGHLEGHRRDGPAAQAWGVVPLMDDRFSVAIGAGVYRFFDTHLLPDGSYENLHGWAPIYSLAAGYSWVTPWFAQLTVNYVRARGDIDTSTFLAGVGYRFRGTAGASATRSAGEDAGAVTAGYELTPFAGEVVLNQPGNESGVAEGLEFRMGLDRHFDWTATLLNEDVSEALHRTGIGTQVWLVDAFLDRRVTLGFGAGVYGFLADARARGSAPGRRVDFASLLTVTAGYRFSDRWFARFNWDRVGSRDSRDSDIFALGIGRRWDR